ncbi:MAG: hypothetical protein WKG00_33065 [Polyangiaceae bacterium]
MLQRIAGGLDATRSLAMSGGGAPARKLEALLLALLADTGGDEGRLLMRELLDNRQRAKRADRWYLRSFLDRSPRRAAGRARRRPRPRWRPATRGPRAAQR